MYTFYNWLIFDVENHVQHHPLVPYISDKSQLKFWSFSQSELLLNPGELLKKFGQVHRTKKTEKSPESSKLMNKKESNAEQLPWKEMCVWVYTVCVFFGGVVNAGWFMRSKSSTENSPVWEMLPETMWEAHRPCFLQIIVFSRAKTYTWVCLGIRMYI